MDDEFIISLCNSVEDFATVNLGSSDLNEMQVKFINKKKKKKTVPIQSKGFGRVSTFTKLLGVCFPYLKSHLSGVCNQCPYLKQKRLF